MPKITYDRFLAPVSHMVRFPAFSFCTFDAAGADPDDVVFGAIVPRRHVADHGVEDIWSTTYDQLTVDVRIALLQSLDDTDCWVLVLLDAAQQLKLQQKEVRFHRDMVP